MNDAQLNVYFNIHCNKVWVYNTNITDAIIWTIYWNLLLLCYWNS